MENRNRIKKRISWRRLKVNLSFLELGRVFFIYFLSLLKSGGSGVANLVVVIASWLGGGDV